MGLGGLVIYLLLIYKLLRTLWQQIKLRVDQQSAISCLSVGLFAALMALLAVNVFTPYLNHPLGIGFILIVSVWLDFIQKKEIE